MAVVKSNAYGHELTGFAREVSRFGVDWLGVDSITEANALRKEGIKKPLLVLGYTLPAHFALAGKNGIALAISAFESLGTLAKAGKKVAVHIKFDSGMHRQGFNLDQLAQVCSTIHKHPHVQFQGFFTHFASAKKPDSEKHTEKQIRLFTKAVNMVKGFGFNPLCHASATAGTLNYPEANFDMVRVGIGLYGLWPSSETRKSLEKKIILKPVMTWKTLIAEVKWVEKGECVGYDYTEQLARKTRLAVLPIGYWHGYWRAFSSKAFVLVKGQKARVVGRVSMDMIVVDVTDIKNVGVGNEVVLLGNQGKQFVTADSLAVLADTTNYEIVTRINPLIKKNFI